MGFSKDAYEYALDIVNQRKVDAERLAERKKSEIYSAVPALVELESDISRTGLAAVRAAARLNGTQKLLELKEAYTTLEAKRDALLKQCGLSQADFFPKYTCSRCNDSGYYDGYICTCAKELARRFEYDKLNKFMPLEKSTFELFDLNYYSGESQTNMKQVLAFCKDYAENFKTDSTSLLFHGKTGLGKTHLSLSIVNEVLARAFGVMYSSAQNFLEQLEKEHFGRCEGNTLELLCSCDLLIIDDLGAEFQTAFTVSAVHNIINSRIMNGLPTIISTNLKPDEITKAYGERVMSRILGNFKRFEFKGTDIRQKLATNID